MAAALLCSGLDVTYLGSPSQIGVVGWAGASLFRCRIEATRRPQVETAFLKKPLVTIPNSLSLSLSQLEWTRGIRLVLVAKNLHECVEGLPKKTPIALWA